MTDEATICAIATAPGKGAIAVIRLSGEQAIEIGDALFIATSGEKLAKANGNTIHFGKIQTEKGLIDEVLVSVFKAPRSYTGENTIEISCHGSTYIQQQLLQACIEKGARMAQPGEFTLRAFLNGKMDLSQAEAVADLIASESGAQHKLALNQMKGSFSQEINQLRNQLLHFISLIELELDFSDEDVEFADRTQLHTLINVINSLVYKLIQSFSLGNVLKNGVPVAIVGKTNVGKSTLLNTLLQEEKAIVSEIAGTTRDVIEDVINIQGVPFRFIDTAGIRKTSDIVENMGIERTFDRMGKARIILLLADATDPIDQIIAQFSQIKPQSDQKLALVLNKVDKVEVEKLKLQLDQLPALESIPKLYISAKKHLQIDQLIQFLLTTVQADSLSDSDVVVSNARHVEALHHTHEAGLRVVSALENQLTTDLLAQDIREMLFYLGQITGQVTTDEILSNIFVNFCIGK